MLEIRNVLFPTDFTECAEAALGQALLFAERHGATLHMLHALVLHGDDPHAPEHRFPALEEIREQLSRDAAERLSTAAEAHRARDVEIVTEERRAIAAAPAILEYAEEEEIDLVAMGTHGRRLSRFLLGSVAAEVVRRSPCPVITVRHEKDRKDGAPPRRILVPVDFSEHAALAMAYARELASTFDAGLHVLHVVEEAIYPEFYYPILASSLPTTPELRERVEKELEEWIRESAGDDGGAEAHVSGGRAPHEIVDVAKKMEADLMVIASHGRTGAERVLLGSVAEGVVRQAHCPVLTVKAFGRQILP